jgi:uncharacterized protein (DUF2267 family)
MLLVDLGLVGFHWVPQEDTASPNALNNRGQVLAYAGYAPEPGFTVGQEGGNMTFEKYAAKGNEIVKEIARALGDPDGTERAERVLRSVLHALRNAMIPEEAVQFMGQLPLVLKGVFVDGWDFQQKKKMRNMQEFLEEARNASGKAAARDFGNDQEAKRTIKEVIYVLRCHFSEGQVEHTRDVLPKHLQELFERGAQENDK